MQISIRKIGIFEKEVILKRLGLSNDSFNPVQIKNLKKFQGKETKKFN